MEQVIAIISVVVLVGLCLWLFFVSGEMKVADEHYRAAVVNLLVINHGWTQEDAEKKVQSFTNIYALRSWQESLP